MCNCEPPAVYEKILLHNYYEVTVNKETKLSSRLKKRQHKVNSSKQLTVIMKVTQYT